MCKAHPTVGAVLVTEPMFGLQFLGLPGQIGLNVTIQSLSVVGMHKVNNMVAGSGGRVVAELLPTIDKPHRAVGEVPAGHVPFRDADIRGADGNVHTSLSNAESLFDLLALGDIQG